MKRRGQAIKKAEEEHPQSLKNGTVQPGCSPAPPKLEFLDDTPKAINRPLDLVDGHAYASTVLWAKKTITEKTGKNGEIIRLDPPTVSSSRQFFVVRDDGRLFGPNGDKPISKLGLEVHTHAVPNQEKLWRGSGVTAYWRGEWPDLVDVFERTTSVYDRFIDFRLSLADQATMCEFCACASLVTWFSPAFTVLPYIWPTGGKGSGKTQLGICWAMTSYLGEMVLSSSSFPSIRDLAHYGAALVFDDAEIFSNPRANSKMRELALAGNRRGAGVTLKEPTVNGKFKIRWVNAYGPRAFTAISTPDPVLASRTITIPLVPTSDPLKGNSDPANMASWPCDHRQLQDDLWAAALAFLPEAEDIWMELEREPDIIGREFEPWRSLVTVARLFERHGVKGLEKRIRRVMAKSKAESQHHFEDDPTIVVIKALLRLAHITDTSDTSDIRTYVVASATHVAKIVKRMAEENEVEDFEWDTPHRVGRILSRLRLRRERTPDRNRRRRWKISTQDLIRLARGHGITLPS